MQQINDTTFQAEAKEHSVETVVGDEKQPSLLPRVKIKRWDNEANFSLGLADTNDFALTASDEKIELQKGNSTAHFYELKADDLVPATKIRRTVNNERWTAVQATAEYEVAHKFIEPGTISIANYVINEAALGLFDMMPAEMHVDADAAGTAKDHNYANNSAYSQGDIDWPKYHRIKLVRYSTPYTQFVNPMYIDEGLHHIDVQWHGTDLPKAINLLMDSIEEVLGKFGVVIQRDKSRAKLYYKHGKRWVKFFSGQPIKDAIASYINISSSYNKAYDFYKPGVEQDVRDEFAYGLSNGHPEIDHEVVNDIILDYARRLALPIEDKPYTAEETKIWERAQQQSADVDWILTGKRRDANWVRQRPIDGFEFEVTYSTKPASNEIKLTGNVPKNVVASVQAELSGEEQIKEKTFRSPTAFRSLAVYHAEQTGNKYKTGKVAHIYRPIAHDATGDAIFCEFKELINLPDGTEYDLSRGLTIVVPQDYLDNATYPVTVDPTFGYTSAGGSSIVLADTIIGIQAASSSYTKVTAIAAYFSDPDSNYGSVDNYQGALYEVAGVFPANWRFLNHTQSYTNTSGDAGARHTGTQYLNFDRPQTIKASTSHYICIWGNATSDPYGGTVNINYDTITGSNTSTKSQAYTVDSWPTTLSGVTTISSASVSPAARKYSLYAITGNVFPVISATSTAAATTDSYNAFAPANSRAWAATNTYDSVMPITDIYFNDLYVRAETTPGAVGSGAYRMNYFSTNSSSSALGAYISEATTEGSDVSNGVSGSAGTPISFLSQAINTPASSRLKWRLAYTAANQILFASTAQLTSNSATRYLGIDAALLNATNTINQVMPASGTLKNMYVMASAALTGAGSYAVSLIQNGSSVGSVTLNSSNQFGTAIPSGISVAAGDLLYYQITPTSTPTSVSIGMGIEFAADTAGTGVLLGGGNANVATTGNSWNAWHDGTWATTTESNVQALSYDMVITDLYVKLGTAPGTSKSRTLTLRCNSADTGATVTISGANTTGSWSGRVQLSRDQLINMAHTPAGTPAASTVTYGIAFISTIDPNSDSMLSMGVG